MLAKRETELNRNVERLLGLHLSHRPIRIQDVAADSHGILAAINRQEAQLNTLIGDHISRNTLSVDSLFALLPSKAENRALELLRVSTYLHSSATTIAGVLAGETNSAFLRLRRAEVVPIAALQRTWKNPILPLPEDAAHTLEMVRFIGSEQFF